MLVESVKFKESKDLETYSAVWAEVEEGEDVAGVWRSAEPEFDSPAWDRRTDTEQIRISEGTHYNLIMLIRTGKGPGAHMKDIVITGRDARTGRKDSAVIPIDLDIKDPNDDCELR